MIDASGVAMQFGANGCGKSAFMKILSRELEPSVGTVATDSNRRRWRPHRWS